MTTTTPKYGFTINYAQRENGWMGPLHDTQQKLDTLVGLRVKSMTTTAQPGSPANGDAYWTPAGATGGWTANRINVYLTNKPVNPTTVAPVSPTSGWYAIEAKPGLLMIVEDQSDALYAYGAGGWVTTGAAAPFLYKAACRVVATSNIDEATGGLLTIDDIVLVAGDRVLLTGQTAAAENGIYVAAAGAWSRAADADISAEVMSGMLVPVTEGTANADSLWLLTTNNPITLNTTALAFTKYGTLPAASVLPLADTIVLRGPEGEVMANRIAVDATDPLTLGAQAGVFTNDSGVGSGSKPTIAATNISADAAGVVAIKGTATAGSNGSGVEGYGTGVGVFGEGTDASAVGVSGYSATGKGGLFQGSVALEAVGPSNLDAVGVGNLPAWPLDITRGATASGGVAYGVNAEQALTAAANNDELVGVRVAPSFVDGGYTGVTHYDMKWLIGKILSAVADGASAVGFDFVTQALSTAGALALRVKNNTTVLFTLDKDGHGVFTGSIKSAGRVAAIRVVTAAGAVTVTTADDVVVVNKSSGAATTVNLPAVASGLQFTIKDGKGDAFTNNITITPASGNIDGAATKVMNVNYDSMTVACDGTNWWVI